MVIRKRCKGGVIVANSRNSAETITVEDASPAEIDNENKLASILDTLNAGEDDVRYQLRVYRLTKNNAEESYLETIDSAELEELADKLRDKYKGGFFRVKLLQNGRFFKKIDYRVEPPIENVARETSPELSAIAQILKNQQASIDNLLQRITTPPAQILPPSDPFSMMEKSLAMVASIAGIRRNDAPQTNVMEMFMKGLEFAKELNPSDREPGMTDIVTKLIETIGPAIAPALQGAIAARTAKPQPRVAPPPVAPVNHPIPQTAPISETVEPIATQQENQQAQQFLSQMAFLVNAAKNNHDPYNYVGFIIENAPPNLIDTIVKTPNIVEQFGARIPDVLIYKGWFDELIDAIRQSVLETGDGAPQDHHSGTDDNVGGDTAQPL